MEIKSWRRAVPKEPRMYAEAILEYPPGYNKAKKQSSQSLHGCIQSSQPSHTQIERAPLSQSSQPALQSSAVVVLSMSISEHAVTPESRKRSKQQALTPNTS